MVHEANARPSVDGAKVGGHQASSASVVSLLTALYFKALRPGDVVATKAHAAPAFYAIQFLRGRLDGARLATLREFGGLQAYPSRRKNPEIVDLSTGSMGLGAVMTTFGALATRYLVDHGGSRAPERFVVMVGDAELDEGNVWEALAEEPLARLGDVLWIVDVNRQSLDRIVPDSRTRQLGDLFRAHGWRVRELRWGRRLEAAFRRPGGDRLQQRLETMPSREYQRLLRLPPGAARRGAPGSGRVERNVRRRDVDAGSVGPRARRSRASSRGRRDRHGLGGRLRDDAPRRLDQPHGRVRARGATGPLRRRSTGDGMARVAGRPPHRARDRRAQPVSAPRCARSHRRGCRHHAAADRHALRSVRAARPRRVLSRARRRR